MYYWVSEQWSSDRDVTTFRDVYKAAGTKYGPQAPKIPSFSSYLNVSFMDR